MRHDGRRVALISGPPISHRNVLQPMSEQLIDHIDFHGGAAGTATRPFKGVGQFFVEATLRAIFEEDAAK